MIESGISPVESLPPIKTAEKKKNRTIESRGSPLESSHLGGSSLRGSPPLDRRSPLGGKGSLSLIRSIQSDNPMLEAMSSRKRAEADLRTLENR